MADQGILQALNDPYLDAFLSPVGLARLNTGGKYLASPFHNYLNDKLMAVERGEIKRLALSVPPQHGKSYLTSQHFPAWWLGIHPNNKVIMASYSSALADDFGGEAKHALKEHGERVFGEECLPRKGSDSKSNWTTNAGGGMFTAGVGGGATGRGAHLFIVDDPVKNYQEAASPTYQERNLNWYKSVALTRLQSQAPIILIGTRWHQKDLIGQVLKEAEETGEHWEVINFKALADDKDPLGRKPGEPLAAFRFDKDELEWKRKAMGSFLFGALYQGEPTPEGGGHFKSEWFQYYDIEEHPNGAAYFVLRRTVGVDKSEERRVSVTSCWMFQTVDTADTEKETSDFFVVSTWAVTPDKELILMDVDRRRADTTKHDGIVLRNYDKWVNFGLKFVGVEKKQSGRNVIESLRGTIPVKALIADTDKVSRCLIMSARYEEGMVYHPRPHSDAMRKWLDLWEEELTQFPTGQNDDQVDCVPEGTLIRCRDKVRPIEEVEEGMEVLTHKGRYRRVTGTMNRAASATYTIKADGRPDIEVTGNHRIYTKESKRKNSRRGGLAWNGGHEWISPEGGLRERLHGTASTWQRGVVDVQRIDLTEYAPSTYIEDNGWLVPMTYGGTRRNPKGRSIPRWLEVDDDFAWLLGYYMAEGSRGKHNISFSSHVDEVQFHQRVEAWGEKMGLHWSKSTKGNLMFHSAGSMPLRNFFDQFGTRTELALPGWAMTLPYEKQMCLLTGYLCGDGHFAKGGAVCNGIAPTLMTQIHELSLRLGLPASLKPITKAIGRPQWVVRWARASTAKMMAWIPDGLLEGKKVRFKRGPKAFDQTWLRIEDGDLIGRIRSIERNERSVRVFNIEVDEDESYVANGTVVHNCASYAGIAVWGGKVKEVGAFGPGHQLRNLQREMPDISGPPTGAKRHVGAF